MLTADTAFSGKPRTATESIMKWAIGVVAILMVIGIEWKWSSEDASASYWIAIETSHGTHPVYVTPGWDARHYNRGKGTKSHYDHYTRSDESGAICRLNNSADRERWSRSLSNGRDYLFLSPDGEIVQIMEGKTFSRWDGSASPDLLGRIDEASAKGEVDSVVEIRSGNARKFGIAVGDRVTGYRRERGENVKNRRGD